MTPWWIAAVVAAQIFLITGNLFFKRAMVLTHHTPVPRGRFAGLFGTGIMAMTIYFFTWTGLMQTDTPLSKQYPFEALALIGMVAVSILFLGERLSERSWLGIGLVAMGLIMIAFS
ncbi:MAG: EamA family transporter [Phycisphaerales bacterium]|nr:EamA family transporter [Phycisphaerales bacterium]